MEVKHENLVLNKFIKVRSPSDGASISHTSPWSQPFPSLFLDLLIERFPEEVSRADREKTQWKYRNDSRQPAQPCDLSALQKQMVLFMKLLGEGLTQEINGDGGSI